MTLRLIHLSDLHFRTNWNESVNIVIDELFEDLSTHVLDAHGDSTMLVFSGDFVQAGDNPDFYNGFLECFDSALNEIGIPLDKRICVPGNHDVSQQIVATNLLEHDGVLSQHIDETKFNNYIDTQPSLMQDKFENYLDFERRFAALGVNQQPLSGVGYTIDSNIGVYCLNSATLCCAGNSDLDSTEKGRLLINTRHLNKWLHSTDCQIKILVMHHPLDWFSRWASEGLNSILHKRFCLCLSGHVHDQSFYTITNTSGSVVRCSAPPLFTNVHDDLGYSVIDLDSDEGVVEIHYRHWSKERRFVSGSYFSNTDSGVIDLRNITSIVSSTQSSSASDHELIANRFDSELNDALCAFSTQPPKWVDRKLSSRSEHELFPDSDTDHFVEIDTLIANPKSTIIRAMPQYGLTCLALFMRTCAWNDTNNEIWLYLDAGIIRPYRKVITKYVDSELSILNSDLSDIKCIILDSYSPLNKDAPKVLRFLCELYPDTPIILMQTIGSAKLVTETPEQELDRDFNILYLWALSRGTMRQIVSYCNDECEIGDENAIIAKVVLDLEVLNLPRTPLNCLTILKVLEKHFDDSPVNRAEMINRVLYLLFNFDSIPDYKLHPDLKDCEYVLGYFCEIMLLNHQYTFTRQEFLNTINTFCKLQFIDLEVQVVFDILYSNNIIVNRGNVFFFKYIYWIHYFIAQRMHHCDEFAAYVFNDMRYASYPEVIEFYTGIDRRRKDALVKLVEDLDSIQKLVDDKCGLPPDMDPYKTLKWIPTNDSLLAIESEIGEGVIASRLPDSVKDKYLDRTYDQTRPYSQEINYILKEYSLAILMNAVIASSRALRNSDYVDPETKRELFDSIIRCWNQIAKILFVMTPILADKGNAQYYGTSFVLTRDFPDNYDERYKEILLNIPMNIAAWYGNDLYSHRMGPLLIEQMRNEENAIMKHLLLIIIVNKRPRGWHKCVLDYIQDNHKNSYYLSDALSNLRTEYRYSFESSDTLLEIANLIKASIARHASGAKKISAKSIKKISDKVLPPRESSIEESKN